VSAVETPAAELPVERTCPRCGQRLNPEQDWCLSCGADVGTRIAQPRGWRVPLAVVGVLLTVALAALILALVQLAGPAEHVTEVPAASATPAAPAVPTPVAGETPAPSADGTPIEPTPDAGADVKIERWPQDQRAWTLVLNSSGTRADARRLAREIGAKGVPVGVLNSNRFRSLGPDSWVVFSGRYADRAQAEAALTAVRAQAGGGSAREIIPRR
jgi:septal ring-binding cell division protein DamX